MTLIPTRRRFRLLPQSVSSAIAASSLTTSAYKIGCRYNGLNSLKLHSKSIRSSCCPSLTTYSTYFMLPSHQAASQSQCFNLHQYFQLRLSSNESKLPLLSRLQEEVLKVEAYPPGFISTNIPHRRVTKIHGLMEEASSLKSIHGAELVERLCMH
jgi:hypothetical protein